MVVRSLLRRKLRTFFALVGVAVGVAAIVSLTAVTQGTIHQYERMAAAYRGDVMVQRAGMPDPVLSQLDPALAGELRLFPGVKAAHPIAFYAMKVMRTAGGKSGARFFLITGVPSDSELLRRHKLVSGRYFGRRGEVILGSQAAEILSLEEGESLGVDKQKFNVVGIYHTGIRIMDRGALGSMEDIAVMRRTTNVNLIALDLEPGRTSALVGEITARHPDLEAMISAEVLDHFDQVRLFRNVAFGVSVIAAILAAIGVLNTLMMSVYERTKELGLLRALGWPHVMIARLIFGEGLLIAVVGGAAGISVGVAGTEILIRTIDIGLVDAHYPPGVWLFGMAMALAVGALGSALPAVKAMRITPLEALRHE